MREARVYARRDARADTRARDVHDVAGARQRRGKTQVRAARAAACADAARERARRAFAQHGAVRVMRVRTMIPTTKIVAGKVRVRSAGARDARDARANVRATPRSCAYVCAICVKTAHAVFQACSFMRRSARALSAVVRVPTRVQMRAVVYIRNKRLMCRGRVRV